MVDASAGPMGGRPVVPEQLAPGCVWLMVPAAPVDDTLAQLEKAR